VADRLAPAVNPHHGVFGEIERPSAGADPQCGAGPQPDAVVFGGAPIAGLYAPVSAEQAAATLEAAWAAGVRAFDTAPHYGVGLSEQRIGRFLAGRPRAGFTVSTKVGRRLVPAAGDVDGVAGFYGAPALTRVRDYSGDGVRATLAGSLDRLGLSRVGTVFIHDPEDHAAAALDGAYPALRELRDEGTVGAIGVGMNTAAGLRWFVERADLDCVLIAGRYTLLDTSAAADLFPACRQRGVKVLVGGVFNSGILADPRPGARYDYAPAAAPLLARAQRIRAVCARYGVPIGAAAVRFTLRHPGVTGVVLGARSPAEITADVGYLATDVPDDLFGDLAAEGLVPEPPGLAPSS
jgi:D-threo-aldose 1-dehydrogenase